MFRFNKKAFSWALYDVGNSAFATTVIAGFFPIFYKQFWSSELSASQSTFNIGLISSLAAVMVCLVSIVGGFWADRKFLKKRFCLVFSLVGISATTGLFFANEGQFIVAGVLYGFGLLGFSSGIVFYDALLVHVADDNTRHRISALGYSLGYLGGGLVLFFNIIMLKNLDWFGFHNESEAVRWSFIIVAVWWAVFILPLWFFVDENKPRDNIELIDGVRSQQFFLSLKNNFKYVFHSRNLTLFLLAYWCYIDGVGTIIRMAVVFGTDIGLEPSTMLLALLLTQIVSFPAAFFFGLLGQRFGPKLGIFIGIGVYLFVTCYAYFLTQAIEFYTFAVLIGLVQGGVQSLSRSFYTQMIPSNKSAIFFGLYNIVGKSAAVLGPIMVGASTLVFDNIRFGILTIALFFLLGAYFLNKVDHEVVN